MVFGFLFFADSINLKTLTVGFLWIIREELASASARVLCPWMHFILSIVYLSGGQRIALQYTECSQMALQVSILYKWNLEVDHNFSTLLSFPDRIRNTVLKSCSRQHLTFVVRLPFHFPEAIRFLQYLLFCRSHLF